MKRKYFSVPNSLRPFPTFSLSGSVYLALRGGLWFIWSCVLCSVLSMGLFGFFYMQLYSLMWIICWRCSFCPMYMSDLFIKIRCPLVCGFMSGSSGLFHWSVCLVCTNLMHFYYCNSVVHPEIDTFFWSFIIQDCLTTQKFL